MNLDLLFFVGSKIVVVNVVVILISWCLLIGIREYCLKS